MFREATRNVLGTETETSFKIYLRVKGIIIITKVTFV